MKTAVITTDMATFTVVDIPQGLWVTIHEEHLVAGMSEQDVLSKIDKLRRGGSKLGLCEVGNVFINFSLTESDPAILDQFIERSESNSFAYKNYFPERYSHSWFHDAQLSLESLIESKGIDLYPVLGKDNSKVFSNPWIYIKEIKRTNFIDVNNKYIYTGEQAVVLELKGLGEGLADIILHNGEWCIKSTAGPDPYPLKQALSNPEMIITSNR